VGLRAASAFASTDIAFKIVDFLRQHSGAWDRGVACEYCRFLIPFPVLAIVYPDHMRRLARPDLPGRHVVRILGGTAVVVAGIVVVRTLSGIAVVRSSPPLDHVVRLLVFVPTIEAISRVLDGIERLAGYETRPIIRNAFRARTVAEFWRRYNYRMHDWYDRNVFRPSDGRHAPARGVALVFLVSGLHHELMFGIATSEFTGYQFAFFLLQAPAVMASGRLERWARRGGIAGKVAAHGATILFMAATSVLFFHGVAVVFPSILANGSPLP